jgi:hypothetical protein
MPTKEQIASATEHIKDVIGRRYIEGDGDMCSCWFQPEGGGPVGMTIFQGVPVGTPEPFADVPYRGKLELLLTYVDWKGFSLSQESDVTHRVIDGKSPELWMDGIDVTRSHDDGKEQFKRILEEQTIDHKAARLRDTGQDHEKFLKEATERALASMQVKDRGHER